MKAILYILTLLTVSLPTIAPAQPGALDNTFGTGGKVITSLGNFGDNCNAVAIQSDEKIVVGGFTQSSFTSSDFALVRYNADGTLDNTFGTGGKVITPVETNSRGNSVAMQSDGKILLGGASHWYINLVRYHSDGTLDTTFGAGGKIITDIEGYYSEQCTSVAIQNDGKILLGGYGHHNANDNPYFIMVRYHSDGTLDGTFGTGGVVIGSTGSAYSMGIQNDGKIVLAGSSDWSFALLRFNADGTPDSSFGTGGEVLTPVGSSGESIALGIQSDGKIVLGGYSYPDGSNIADFTMVRYHSDGTLDNTFGVSGIVITNIGSASAMCHALGLQDDGKILLAGDAINDDATISDFALMRYNSDGSLDNSFGNAGKVMTPVGASYSTCNALAIKSNGKIVLGGNAYNGANTDMAVVQYIGEAGTGIEEAGSQLEGCSIYPNPFNTTATIRFDKPLHEAVIKIYNTCGQKVQEITHISGMEVQISRNNLPAGIYFLQLTAANKIISTAQLVIY